MHFWIRQYPVKDAADDIQVNKSTACGHVQVVQGGVLNYTVGNTSDPGEVQVVIVQVDEIPVSA